MVAQGVGLVNPEPGLELTAVFGHHVEEVEIISSLGALGPKVSLEGHRHGHDDRLDAETAPRAEWLPGERLTPTRTSCLRDRDSLVLLKASGTPWAQEWVGVQAARLLSLAERDPRCSAKKLSTPQGSQPPP